MKIINLTAHSHIYTGNVYLVLGNHNALADVNTLIDVGRDPEAISKLGQASTGVGKKRVDQVIITHEHYDHAGLLAEIKREYQPRVYAYNKSEYVDHAVREGKKIRVGDCECEVIHTPGHTYDSICIYCEAEGILFSGDTSLDVITPGCYEEYYIRTLEKLRKKVIRTVYPGHGKPITKRVRKMIQNSLKNVTIKNGRKRKSVGLANAERENI